MPEKNRKSREGIVYSTSDSFEYAYNEKENLETIEPAKQKLVVSLDKKARAGKKVTLISGFIGATNDLEVLGKLLKTKCGVGGSAKDNEILIQGDFREQVFKLLIEQGYKATKKI